MEQGKLWQGEVKVDEKLIERKLVSAVKKMGGLCLKFVSPGNDGMPDRILLFPQSRIGFVEVKRRGKLLRPIQRFRRGQLHRLGFQALTLDDPAQIPLILQKIRGENNPEIPTAPVPDLRD